MKEHIWLKRILYISLILIFLGGYKAYRLYHKAFAANIFTPDKKEMFLYIPTGSDYDAVMNILRDMSVVKNMDWLEWTAEKKNYGAHVNAGKYRLRNRMSSNALINILRSGRQFPVKLTFNNIRTLDDLADKIAEQLEPDADTLLKVMHSPEIQKKYGFNDNTIISMFIPNTYEFFWNTSPEQFMERMNREYNAFWTDKREFEAQKAGLSKTEVITLASIVNEETQSNEEKPRIAGVYINRLNRGMRLQADPTVVFALGDFTIQRVWSKHYESLDSPYNTYKHAGLPPGPICIPEISSIDAVLNYEKNNYLYFCAKPDFSGKHNFARTLDEHNRNAALYRRELNKRRIYR